jgi:hypothetical protein
MFYILSKFVILLERKSKQNGEGVDFGVLWVRNYNSGKQTNKQTNKTMKSDCMPSPLFGAQLFL